MVYQNDLLEKSKNNSFESGFNQEKSQKQISKRSSDNIKDNRSEINRDIWNNNEGVFEGNFFPKN